MNNFDNVCPICEKGELTPSTHTSTFDYHEEDLVVDNLEVSMCNLCCKEFVLPQQNKNNRVKIADQKRKLDHLLTSNEIISLRKKYNLTQIDASKLFGGGTNAFSKYERGDVIQSAPMDKLLRLINNDPLLLVQLAEDSEIGIQLIQRIMCEDNEQIAYALQDISDWEVEIDDAHVEKRTVVLESHDKWEEVA